MPDSTSGPWVIIEKIFGKQVYNRLILFNLGHVAWISIVWLIFGLPTVAYHLVYSALSVSLLEIINYVEHYGLMREKNEAGVYEPVTIRHSWNAPQRFTNYLLIKLQRHSDHHANAYKPYQILNTYEESAQMPHGYSIAILLAMVPPIWKKFMDPYGFRYLHPGQYQSRNPRTTSSFSGRAPDRAADCHPGCAE